MTKTKKHSSILSKSRYLAGLQCSKLLWTHFNAKENLPSGDEVDPDVAFRFEHGHRVGELAQKLYPDGILIDWDSGFDAVLKDTQEALKARKPIFEAAFIYDNAYTRADILVPAGKKKWDIVEVKSTTAAKDHHIDDLAFQRYVYEGAGLAIRRSILMHINSRYIRQGELQLDRLFACDDLSSEVNQPLADVKENVDQMFKIIQKKKCPKHAIGPHCDDPYGCDLHDSCWSFLPEHHVFDLRGGNKKAYKLLADGVLALSDIPPQTKLSDKQTIQIQTVKSGIAHCDKNAIRSFLKSLVYPLYYLDFETFATPIPHFDDSRPYQQIPFQFSLHIQHKAGAKTEHVGFLPESKEDPRSVFLKHLRAHLGKKGSIIVYNQGFEKARLKECAQHFPKYAKWVDSVLPRFVDLLKPFSSFSYYHPDQHGSASLKAVLPALTDQDYEDLDIADGGSAMRIYLHLLENELSQKEQKKILRDLDSYCKRDTEGMVWIIEKLRKLVAA